MHAGGICIAAGIHVGLPPGVHQWGRDNLGSSVVARQSGQVDRVWYMMMRGQDGMR